MKKILSLILAGVMAVTGCVLGYAPVEAAPVQGTSGDPADAGSAAYREGEALVLMKETSAVSRNRAKSVLGADDGIRIIDKWTFTQPEDAAEDAVDGLSSAKAKKKIAAGEEQVLNVVRVKTDRMTTEQLVKELEANDDVEIAEPNYIVRACNVDDTYFGYQWGLKNTGQNSSSSGKSLNVSAEWDKGSTGSDKVVAVVDSGIDYGHEDLRNNMWKNTHQPDLRGEYGFDFANRDNDPMDDNGHGTHCAGIIGAVGSNGTGISGVNRSIRLMALKTLNNEGEGDVAGSIGAYNYINKALDLGEKITAVNNSWGGGDESEIFTKLVDIVGAKGAVSICAAGNDANDNDEGADFPASINSPYLISVAAINEDGELAGFSNYGKKSVDIAAPGTNILSTVSSDCYNPTIYDGSKQEKLSAVFSDFDKDASGESDGTGTGNSDSSRDENSLREWDVAGIKDSAVSSVKGRGEKSGINVTYDGDNWFGKGSSGRSLKISWGELSRGEIVSFRLPYNKDSKTDAEDPQVFSLMSKVTAPETGSDSEAMLMVIDVPAGTKLSGSVAGIFNGKYRFEGAKITGSSNYWDHFTLECGEVEPEKTEREIVVLMSADESGEYALNIDDAGLSRTGVSDGFGKYDFYNGTSMAAPFVTGAAALAAAKDDSADGETVLETVMSWLDESDLPVSSGGSLDMSKATAVSPRIGSVTVDIAGKQIIINGRGFGSSPEVTVDTADKKGQKAVITSSSDRKIVLKDEGWINRIVDINITGSSGKKLTEKNVYLVKGKKGYQMLDGVMFPSDEGIIATDGSRIFVADPSEEAIYAAKTGRSMQFRKLCSVDAEKYFGSGTSETAEYALGFGSDLVYMDGRLYSIVSYSETVSDDSDSDGSDVGSIRSGYADSYDDGNAKNSAAYSSQYRMMSFDTSSGKVTDLGRLPKDMKKAEDFTLAAYNGRLYMIGGYDYGKSQLSTKVKIYDPSGKKWSDGPALPEGRAGGRALQSGGSLVYTLGYSAGQKNKTITEQKCPANLILRGTKWTVTKAELVPYCGFSQISRSGDSYLWYHGDIGLCSGGIAYMGIPADSLGDTFTYDVKADRYDATEYCHIDLNEGYYTFHGVVAGKRLYGADGSGDAHRAVLSSGLVKVKAPSYRGGKIVNAGKSVMPGSAVTLKAVPKKGYLLRSFTVNGRKVSGRSKTLRLTSDCSARASFVKAASKISLSRTKVTLKPGESFTLKAKVTPKDAYDRSVTFRSGNTKYATVSSKGVVKAKRAGKGRTVTITVKAKDGSGKTATCRVKISK